MDIRTSVLRITYLPEILNGEPILITSNSLPVKVSHFEPAGHAFHLAALKLSGYEEEEEADTTTDNQSATSEEKDQTYMPSSNSYSAKGKKKSSDGKQQQDHYALLGLAHLRFLATEEQIRKCYRETALKHHPDKQAALLLMEETEEAKQAKKEEIESHFKKIQEAYEVLLDPAKRRIYDSTDEFDDEVPTECAPQDFFKVFGAAFMRNGKWSVNQPVPSLGSEKTSIEEVDGFYNFWYSFKSWREFPHADEFEIEQAESRDHKRWMERQNGKLREKARKEEYLRVRSLIDNAYKKDPRIARRKEEEKAEKKRRKEARFMGKRLQEEAAARAAEEERRRKEEEDKRAAEAALIARKQKEEKKKLLRKEKSRLRKLSKSSAGISEDDVESLCASLDLDSLRSLCDEMEGKEEDEGARLLKHALNKEVSIEPNGLKVNGVVAVADEGKKEKAWGKEEIEMLRKGVVKFPKGTGRRWEVISEYIGTGRSVEEILKATKTVLLQKPDSAKAFDSFLEKRKTAQSIESPLTTRDESENLPAKEVVPENPTSSEEEIWSGTQEKALVQALKTFPKDAAQRWERVAAAVNGKTVSQCKKKFASLRETFRSKKSAE